MLTKDKTKVIIKIKIQNHNNMKTKIFIRSSGIPCIKLFSLLIAVSFITTSCKKDPPVADFTGTPKIITPGQSVQFTDESALDPTSWSWNFGDGEANSTLQNPLHTYPTAGTYTVTLTATNDDGSVTKTKTNYVRVSDVLFNPDVTYGSVSDIDGNTYFTIQIGTQTWMAENLKTTKYNDGTGIQLVTGNSAWASLSSPAYCWPNNDAATYKEDYGAVYNWYAVSATTNGGKNICPTGWHVPNEADWITLTDYLGGEDVAGGNLKETGTTHWASPNEGANNQTGFTGIPCASRFVNGAFQEQFESFSEWWSAETTTQWGSYSRRLYYNDSKLSLGQNVENFGCSVRCVKD